MELKDILTIVAILLSPIFAVYITIWYTNNQEERKQKRELFLILIAYRKTYPPPVRYVDALNTIDVIFHDNKNILAAWKNTYSALHPPAEVTIFDPQPYYAAIVILLIEIAKELGYKNINATVLDAYYLPQAHANERDFLVLLNKEWMRVLNNSLSFGTPKPPPTNTETQPDK
jgi:hypothetical protein